MYAYDWDPTTNVVVRSSEHVEILGLTEPLCFPHQQFVDKIHPDDRPNFLATIAGLTPENPTGEVTYRALAADGALVWLKSNGRGFFDAEGRLLRVIGMVADVTAQKLAEEKLRASEERLRLAQWAARIGTFDLNIRTGVDIWPPETEALYGLPPGGFGGTWTAFENLIHPDDRGKIIELGHEMMRTGQPAEGEWRVVWPDGSVHWIAGRGQVLMDESGEPSRMLGVNLDVTERKLAEKALAGLSGRLIDAQEEERKRIAREIHDDYTQRLAMVAIDLERLAEHVKDFSAEAQQQLRQLWSHVSEIGADLHSLSHSLHSSTLENLGPVAGIRAFCEEFSDQQGIEVDFAHKNVPHGTPDDVALCLFRIVQESLRNAKRHSGANSAEVRLEGLGEKLHLSVVDRGRGFDVNKQSSESGIGIRSMEERLRLLGGHLEVYSRPTEGTRVEAWLPVKTASRSEVGT
jgi:PAS domain S-box-containing protein